VAKLYLANNDKKTNGRGVALQFGNGMTQSFHLRGSLNTRRKLPTDMAAHRWLLTPAAETATLDLKVTPIFTMK